jgi:hypothetical protein
MPDAQDMPAPVSTTVLQPLRSRERIFSGTAARLKAVLAVKLAIFEG